MCAGEIEEDHADDNAGTDEERNNLSDGCYVVGAG